MLWANDEHFILYDLLESMGNVAIWAPADLYFMPMPARTALPPSANSGLLTGVSGLMV